RELSRRGDVHAEPDNVAHAVQRDPMICTPHKSKSLMIWTTLAPKIWVLKPFWHKRLQCKSYQRRASAAAASGSDGGADAVGSQLHALVRPRLPAPIGLKPPRRLSPECQGRLEWQHLLRLLFARTCATIQSVITGIHRAVPTRRVLKKLSVRSCPSRA